MSITTSSSSSPFPQNTGTISLYTYSSGNATYSAVPQLSLCYGCRMKCNTLKEIASTPGLWLCHDCAKTEGFEW